MDNNFYEHALAKEHYAALAKAYTVLTKFIYESEECLDEYVIENINKAIDYLNDAFDTCDCDE